MSTAPNPNYALASFAKEGGFYSTALLTTGDGVVSRMGTVALGQPFLYRGQIVNIDPVTSAIIPAVLGTSVPNAIVAENCDATLAAQKCLVYVSASVKYDALVWPAGSRSAIIDALRDSDILVENVMMASGQSTGQITPVTLTPATDNELAAGGNGNFAVAMTGGSGTWFWTQDSSSAWVHVTAPTVPQTANGSVQYHVDVNGVGQPARVGKIFVNGQPYTINQAGG
jgi:hypothetical protein